MKESERKIIRQQIREAREQRNLSTTNEEFDKYHNLMEEKILLLKTGEQSA